MLCFAVTELVWQCLLTLWVTPMIASSSQPHRAVSPGLLPIPAHVLPSLSPCRILRFISLIKQSPGEGGGRRGSEGPGNKELDAPGWVGLRYLSSECTSRLSYTGPGRTHCSCWCTNVSSAVYSRSTKTSTIGYGRGFKAERRVIILWLKNSQFTYFTYKYIISITIARILKGHCIFVLLGDFT